MNTNASKYALLCRQLQSVIDEAAAAMPKTPSLAIADDMVARVGADASLAIVDESDNSTILLDHEQAIRLSAFLAEHYAEIKETP